MSTRKIFDEFAPLVEDPAGGHLIRAVLAGVIKRSPPPAKNSVTWELLSVRQYLKLLFVKQFGRERSAPPSVRDQSVHGLICAAMAGRRTEGDDKKERRGGAPPRSVRSSLAYFFPLPPALATVRERALVTNRLRLTPSRSALSTRAW